jgi:hypothetical protein
VQVEGPATAGAAGRRAPLTYLCAELLDAAELMGGFDIAILDLDVSATLSEYDDENDMKAIVRELSLVADAYLRGEGRIERQRGMCRTRPVLRITVHGNEWILGRRTSHVHHPEDGSTEGSHD